MAINFAVITENDESKWKDTTGEIYHFPKRYLGLLTVGSKVIYYKGKLTNKEFKNKRLTNIPHYFGIAEISRVFADNQSKKSDYFAEITKFIPFAKPVSIINEGIYIEQIPQLRASNYWRDGVREISEQIYSKVKNIAELEDEREFVYNDFAQPGKEYESEFFQGGSKKRFTTTYERDNKAREQALLIHGYNCMGCNMNFEETYGEWGLGYIHVHHLNPVSVAKEKIKINPYKDLITVCANCHAMIHRRKDTVLSLEELREKVIKKITL